MNYLQASNILLYFFFAKNFKMFLWSKNPILDDTDCDRNLKPIENNQSIKIQRKESKKVLKMSKVINLPGPVLKICIGKGPMGSGLKCSNGSFEPKPGPSRGGAQNEPVKIVIPKALTCGSKAARRLIKKAKKKGIFQLFC